MRIRDDRKSDFIMRRCRLALNGKSSRVQIFRHSKTLNAAETNCLQGTIAHNCVLRFEWNYCHISFLCGAFTSSYLNRALSTPKTEISPHVHFWQFKWKENPLSSVLAQTELPYFSAFELTLVASALHLLDSTVKLPRISFSFKNPQ